MRVVPESARRMIRGDVVFIGEVDTGLIDSRTLSPLPAGFTHRPCVWRLVPLKQCGLFAA